MTTLNTIIEEEKIYEIIAEHSTNGKGCGDDVGAWVYPISTVVEKIMLLLTTAMQRAYEAGQEQERQTHPENTKDSVEIDGKTIGRIRQQLMECVSGENYSTDVIRMGEIIRDALHSHTQQVREEEQKRTLRDAIEWKEKGFELSTFIDKLRTYPIADKLTNPTPNQ